MEFTAQFYQPEQIEELARIVDGLGIDVYAFGILADFRTKLFPGSGRLVELADRVNTLQVEALCWCGSRATHNARTVGGKMVTAKISIVVRLTVPPASRDRAPAVELRDQPHQVIAALVAVARVQAGLFTRFHGFGRGGGVGLLARRAGCAGGVHGCGRFGYG